MIEPIETIELDNVTVNVYPDTCPSDFESPLSWQNDWRFYSTGGEIGTPIKYADDYSMVENIDRLRYADTIHRGETVALLNLYESCAGPILTRESDIEEANVIAVIDRKKTIGDWDAYGFLDSICKSWTQWAQGEIYWYEVEANDTGEMLDSCGGFIGEDYAIEAAEEAAEWQDKALGEKRKREREDYEREILRRGLATMTPAGIA